ncbi:MAG TPA: radical SAM protein, partial [Bryobacteraceae bacterium]|nr:radical SAM protein [Bryobacteraceae bacterium]
MTPLTTLTLFLSWKCNLRCAHCGFSCGPGRRERLPRETARRAIAEAASISGVRMIAFSGGEPFLFYREMLQHMEQAHSAGLSTGVVTNCYWATSRATAVSRLEEMAGLGLQEVIVSFDDYHA